MHETWLCEFDNLLDCSSLSDLLFVLCMYLLFEMEVRQDDDKRRAKNIPLQNGKKVLKKEDVGLMIINS